ncbi:MAG: adenylate/guanylate cyclase domain-containing protein [Chitinophagaceae bacterium]
MLLPKTKTKISRILPFGIIWFLFSIIFAQLQKGIIGNLSYYPATGSPYDFSKNIIIIPIAGLITGLLIGTMEIVFFNKLFVRKSFSEKISYKSLIYLAVNILFLLSTSLIINFFTTGFNIVAWQHIWISFHTYSFWSIEIYIAGIIVISQFYTEVSESIGLGVLPNFFTGKYYKPVVEERIFMFLDMKSSTSIAEHLGHVLYFKMLKEYYFDLSEAILNSRGEIYQYVGDEVIVSWTIQNNLENNNCINCFFAMKKSIQKEAKKYIQHYGLIPEFKAAIHVGKVTTGEIGVIKKNIMFTGDVLNTTARIQELCNTYNVELLLSNDLLQILDLPPQFQIKPLGKIQLRGREEKINLATIIPQQTKI